MTTLKEQGIPRSVLVVDDDEAVRTAVSALLRGADFTVVTAGDGLEGLTLLSRQWFPVVITDRAMPVLDGIEFAQRLRAMSVAPAYVIMLTASADSHDFERGYCAGVDHYILKKNYEPELVSKVTAGFTAMRRRQLTSGSPAQGPVTVDLESGAHTARHLIGRLSADMAHALRSQRALSVISVCIEISTAPAATTHPHLASAASAALLSAVHGAMRVKLDWVARLPTGRNACRLAIVMPDADAREISAIEQGIRNAFVHAEAARILRGQNLSFGAVTLQPGTAATTAFELLGEAERRRRGADQKSRTDLSSVQGETAPAAA